VVLRHLGTDDAAPGAGRALAQEMLTWLDCGPGEHAEDLILCVSELVSNAVQHGPAGELSLTIAADDGRVRVEVRDEGLLPFDWPDQKNTVGHWGLGLVKELATDSGIAHRPWTVVWCEVDLAA
jgi:anti-sigma regulatory factor (Ser/Thr protein kinase)